MSKKEVTRRTFLTRASALGLAAIGSGVVLSACGGGGDGSGSSAEMEAPAAAPKMEECGDLSGLTDAEKQMRETLGYVGETSMPEKMCDNCQLYVVAEAGSACGGCQIIKGPIAPGGYCTSWAAKVS